LPDSVMTESIKLNIHGRNYSVKKGAFSVDPEEVAALVNSKMQELSGAGGINSTSDLAILAALNIAHEYLENRQKDGKNNKNDENRIDAMIQALEKGVEDLKI
jgi:cell division protein ZapA (FtsZ GTPase activity inhibitor)